MQVRDWTNEQRSATPGVGTHACDATCPGLHARQQSHGHEPQDSPLLHAPSLLQPPGGGQTPQSPGQFVQFSPGPHAPFGQSGGGGHTSGSLMIPSQSSSAAFPQISTESPDASLHTVSFKPMQTNIPSLQRSASGPSQGRPRSARGQTPPHPLSPSSAIPLQSLSAPSQSSGPQTAHGPKCSQPFSRLPSQFSHPTAQRRPHMPATHVGTVCGGTGHTLPHDPQLRTSFPTNSSQPFDGTPSQSR